MSNTQENIINALFQLALKNPERSDFSISEIAMQANISKQAIYQKYFRSTNEILEYLHKIIDTDIFKSLKNYDPNSDSDPFKYFAINTLPLIYKYRNWLKYLYLTALDPNWKNFLKKKYLNWVSKNIKIQSNQNIAKGDFIKIIVGNILTLIEVWMSQEMPDHPQKFSKIFLYSIHTPVYNFVKFS